MKKMLSLVVLSTLMFMGCSSPKKQATEPEKKNLVAYFSCTGNTKKVAEYIAQTTGADLFEIQPAVAYTPEDLDYRAPEPRSTIEMRDSLSRPEIGVKVEDIAIYDTLYLGYPLWWNQAPRIVNTFIESYDLADKAIVLFATSGSQPIDNSVKILKQTYPTLNVVDAKLLTGATIADVENWLKK